MNKWIPLLLMIGTIVLMSICPIWYAPGISEEEKETVEAYGESGSQPGGTSQFTPFTTADCDARGSFPAPDAQSSQIYPVSIYCPFTLIGTVVGSINLSMEYVEDVAKSNYANRQQIWNESLQSLDKMDGAVNYSLLNEPPTQSVIVVVKDTEPGANDMTADIRDLILYREHFVIEINGGVTVTSETDASALELELIKFAKDTADRHYK